MNHILVITTEPLPVPGGLTTGAGLRAWGLAEGLRSRGFPVTIATPLEGEQAMQQAKHSTDDRVRYFIRPELSALIHAVKPDVVVMQHWGLVYALPPLECPLVIDLAGPHLLERLYWGNPDTRADRREKITALQLADYITCGGYYQRHYFYPYLSMAGFDVRYDKFPVIPFSVSPEPVEGQPSPGAELTVVYGGAFLAWQNPEAPLRWLLDEMDKSGSGRLLFYGGNHPSLDASGGRFLALYQLMRGHPRVEMRGWKPFAELTSEYASEGHVALDLMERNPERELAYTTRTMVYLQCGLPVIYNNYSELSPLIDQNHCGWCLDPDDEVGFRQLVLSLLKEPDICLKMRDAARATAQCQSWDKTIGPLAVFCRNPGKKNRAEVKEDADKMSGPELPLPVEETSPPVPFHTKFENFFPNPGKFLGILVYIPVWLVSRYLHHYLRITR